MIRTTILTVISLSVVLISVSCKEKSELDNKPNIVIIYADDLGYGDLSSYGGNISTPHIDRIGQEGIRFTDFYVTAPACTPSRYSLLTGSYPQRSQHGLDDVLMPGDDHHFDDDEVLLPELLKLQGYTTGLIGKWHLGAKKSSYMPSNHGFDEFTGFISGTVDYFQHTYGSMKHDWYVKGDPTNEEGYATDLLTGHAIDFIDQAKNEKNPFFLYLSYSAPHYGKTDPDRIPEGTISLKKGRYKGYKIMNSLQAPEEYVTKHSDIKDEYRRVYAGMISSLDDNIGRLLTKLEGENLLEDTMIWFISDNGGYSESYYGHASNGRLRGEKGTLWEGGIRVPALVSWKNSIDPGQVNNQPLSTIDILPTLGSITGYKDKLSSLPIDGIDISKLLFDETIKMEREIYWRFRGHTALRKGSWKLLNGEKLFNLSSDIREETNLALDYPEKLKKLQKAFEKIDSTLKPDEQVLPPE